MPPVICVDDPAAAHVAALLSHHLTELRGEMAAFAFALDATGLSRPDVAFWTAWVGDALAGFVALKDQGDGSGELKSMRAAPAARGTGVGRALLSHVIAEARARGMTRIDLETGTAALHAPAVSLYRSAGFTDRGPFADHRPSPYNQFLTLPLQGDSMPTLVLIRHGQSAWNLENRFTGWWDVNLTEKGEGEARAAGELLAEKGHDFDVCFTSYQTRAIKTLNLALEAMGRLWLPVEKDWRLNERHYGGLTGLDKAETAALHGDAQVKVWRRSFDVPPPLPEADSKWDLSADRRYAGIDIPQTESLKDTIDRVLPYWKSRIAPELKAGKRVLISAHGNSLRALVKHLSGIPDDEITGLEIPTGQPIVYELADDLTPTDRYYLSER